jgi:N-acetylglucosaminyldiphosphoundecaprenol N-acetyl-beta-D-mannosaminyltransferase
MYMRKLVVILGVPIDRVDMPETLSRLDQLVRTGRETGRNYQVTTINTDFIVKSLRDPELRYLLQNADLAIPDGMPLVWGARLLGVPLTERVAGADLISCLAEMAADKGYSLYLLGAGPGVAAAAAKVLTDWYPNLEISGYYSPPFSTVLEMDAALVDRINAAEPDILLVAFGNPKQEKWIGMYREQLNVPVMIGVGASLDFVAGLKRRAPEWMQRSGLEWLHRLIQEPRRLWRRYIVDLFGFGSFFFWQLWVMRRGHQPETILPTSELVQIDDEVIVNLSGRLTIDNVEWLYSVIQQGLNCSPNVTLNMKNVAFIDSSAIGVLVELTRQARAVDGELWMTSLNPDVHQTITLLRLDRFFALQKEKTYRKESKNGQVAANAVSKTIAIAEENSKWTVLKAPRNLDASTAPIVIQQGVELIQNTPFLIVDFSDTMFLTSAGLAALAQLNKDANALNGQLRLAGCNRDVAHVIHMVRFDKFLSIYESVSVALDH